MFSVSISYPEMRTMHLNAVLATVQLLLLTYLFMQSNFTRNAGRCQRNVTLKKDSLLFGKDERHFEGGERDLDGEHVLVDNSFRNVNVFQVNKELDEKGFPNRKQLNIEDAGAKNIQADNYYVNDIGLQVGESFENDIKFLDKRWLRRILYIWCGSRPFVFANYLSLRSTIRSVNPSVVMFAFEHYPDTSFTVYNSWLADLEAQFPFWIRKNISQTDNLCSEKRTRTVHDIERFLNQNDFLECLYVGDRTVIVEPFVLEKINTNFDYYNQATGQGFLFITNVKDNRNEETYIRNDSACAVVTLNNPTLPSTCFVLDESYLKKFSLDPELIMFDAKPVASQLRSITYGSKQYPYNRKNGENPAPNIAHYAWLGGGTMGYTFYMSVLSALFLGKVENIYIHGDMPPRGNYWTDLMKMDIKSRIYYVPWHRPRSIYSRHVRYIQNQADLIKSSVMWNFGGILMDPDLVFVRPPDPEMFHYEALIMAGGRPRMLNPSVAISKPKSVYSRLWLESEKDFIKERYVWDCCYKMYKTWERNPSIAKVVNDFNLICMYEKCYPMWLDRHAMTKPHLNLMRNVTDWKKRIVTVHFPRPNPYKSFEQCAFHLKGLAGELGRMILRAAGLLEAENGLVP